MLFSACYWSLVQVRRSVPFSLFFASFLWYVTVITGCSVVKKGKNLKITNCIKILEAKSNSMDLKSLWTKF